MKLIRVRCCDLNPKMDEAMKLAKYWEELYLDGGASAAKEQDEYGKKLFDLGVLKQNPNFNKDGGYKTGQRKYIFVSVSSSMPMVSKWLASKIGSMQRANN